MIAAQDRDAAKATWDASQANVKALEDQVQGGRRRSWPSRRPTPSKSPCSSRILPPRTRRSRRRWRRKTSLQTQLGYTEVYSPIDGIVSVRVARQGEVVQPGGPIVTVLDINHLWVQADVEESYIDQIQFGQKLPVQLPSGDIIEGTVFFKGVESDFATQRDVSRTKRDIKSFTIKVAVPNEQRRLFAGMTAYVLLPPPPHQNAVLAFLVKRLDAGKLPSKWTGSPSASAISWPWTTSASPCRKAKSSACSAPTAPARPRSSACSPR